MLFNSWFSKELLIVSLAIFMKRKNYFFGKFKKSKHSSLRLNQIFLIIGSIIDEVLSR